jgi:hypothetical protein
MQRWAFLMSLLAMGCAHLPALAPVPAGAHADLIGRCQQAFPKQPWRATHTIFATLPFGHHGQLLGVLGADADGMRAILLSPEGVSLFDGTLAKDRAGGTALLVRRAVPPFDRPDFAAALMADVSSAYRAPAGVPQEIGTDASGSTVCRWTLPAREATDVMLGLEGPRTIRTYRNLHLTREVRLSGAGPDGFFSQVDMIVPGAGGYTLEMRLVDHE